MEPITTATVVGLAMWMLTAAGVMKDVNVAQGLEAQAARYQQQVDNLEGRHLPQLRHDLKTKAISQRKYVNEVERARQLRRILIDHADLARRMAADRRGNAATSVLKDLALSMHPGARLGKVIGPIATRGGKLVDVSATVVTTDATVSTLIEQQNPRTQSAASVLRWRRYIASQSEDQLIRAKLGHRLTWTVAQWRSLNKEFADDPARLRREFDEVLDLAVARVREYTPELIGRGRQFADTNALRDYLVTTAHRATEPPTLSRAKPEQSQRETSQQETPCPEVSPRCKQLFMRGLIELNKAERAEHAACSKIAERRKACLKKQ